MDYITNFGVSFGTKHKFEEIFEQGRGYKQFKDTMQGVEFREILFSFKYFFWADKKLHHVSYTENKEDINEDLLFEFLGDTQGKNKL